MSSEQDSLRAYLPRLERENLVIKVDKQVDAEFEAAALIKKASKLEKAILFEKVKGADHRVVANVAGNRRMISLALRLPTANFLQEVSNRASTNLKTRLVRAAPVQEVCKEKIDFSKVPILTHFERDAGRYITAGTVVAKDPETGFRNSSFNRMMLRTDSRFGIRMMPPQHLGIMQEKAETRERNLEVAVVIGNHPAEMIASASALPYGKDHLDLASSLRGEPLEVVKCKTVDLEVPANSEMVIEGEVEAHVREEEGPFGEFMDYYVERNKNHVLKIKSVSHRSDYIYQALLCGSSEDLGILALNREILIYRALMAAGYDVVDVSLTPFLFNGIVSIRKRFEGEPKNLMMAAFGTYSWLKYCVIVDEDVNVHDLADVWWALGTRSQPDKALLTVPDALGFPRRDKVQIHRGKIGIDATVPLEMKKQFERKRIPKERDIDFSNYI